MGTLTLDPSSSTPILFLSMNFSRAPSVLTWRIETVHDQQWKIYNNKSNLLPYKCVYVVYYIVRVLLQAELHIKDTTFQF